MADFDSLPHLFTTYDSNHGTLHDGATLRARVDLALPVLLPRGLGHRCVTWDHASLLVSPWMTIDLDRFHSRHTGSYNPANPAGAPALRGLAPSTDGTTPSVPGTAAKDDVPAACIWNITLFYSNKVVGCPMSCHERRLFAHQPKLTPYSINPAYRRDPLWVGSGASSSLVRTTRKPI